MFVYLPYIIVPFVLWAFSCRFHTIPLHPALWLFSCHFHTILYNPRLCFFHAAFILFCNIRYYSSSPDIHSLVIIAFPDVYASIVHHPLPSCNMRPSTVSPFVSGIAYNGRQTAEASNFSCDIFALYMRLPDFWAKTPW